MPTCTVHPVKTVTGHGLPGRATPAGPAFGTFSSGPRRAAAMAHAAVAPGPGLKAQALAQGAWAVVALVPAPGGVAVGGGAGAGAALGAGWLAGGRAAGVAPNRSDWLGRAARWRGRSGHRRGCWPGLGLGLGGSREPEWVPELFLGLEVHGLEAGRRLLARSCSTAWAARGRGPGWRFGRAGFFAAGLLALQACP